MSVIFLRYLYYFENDNPIIQVRYLSGLIALINEQKASNAGGINSSVDAHYRNILGANLIAWRFVLCK